jgi:hypothetical protein
VSGTHRVMDALILVVFVLGLARDTMVSSKVLLWISLRYVFILWKHVSWKV